VSQSIFTQQARPAVVESPEEAPPVAFGALTRVGPLAELGSGQTWQYLCPVCCIPEFFRGYRQEQARAIALPKHSRCERRLAPCEAPAPAPALAIVPPSSPAAPSPPAKALPRPAAPVAAPPTLGAPEGSTLGLFVEERSWSSYQQAIFQDVAQGTGHTTVVARAGTGKTTTLVEAVRRMPQGLRVLVLAFNTSIKGELEKRMPKGVDVRTLHSLGALAIRQATPASRMAPGKLRDILRREEFFPARQQAAQRTAIARLVSFARATLLDPRTHTATLCARAGVDPKVFVVEGPSDADTRLDAPAEPQDPLALALRTIGRIVASVLQVVRLEAGTSHDFDDMLWIPHVLQLPLGQWDRVVVDEAQDLSAVQIELLLRTVAPGGRVLVVGDDRQAIYAFRGADAQAFELLTSRLGAKTLPLTITYRCPRAVVKLAQEEVPDFEAGPGAPEGEVKEVVGLKASELLPGDFVLSRTNAPLLRLFFQCVAAERPAVVQGREGFLDELLSAVEGAMEQAGPGAANEDVKRLALEPFDRAIAARAGKEEDASDLADQRSCLATLFERCPSPSGVRDQLKRLSKVDPAAAAKSVCLSSVHRAKGLERDRVWMLDDTFRRGRSVDEDNLWYVAITRTKKTLVLVKGVR
jgi:DNA helicase-2/ATP-dependent DNA helicase PcrA